MLGAAPAFTVEAEIEQGNHLVFSFDAGVSISQCADLVDVKYSQSRFFQRTQVATRTFDKHQARLRAEHRIFNFTLRRRVAACVVRNLWVRSQTV